MKLQHLRSFVAAVDFGSFAAAADELSYTGPAISQHVAALESEFGAELLDRHARGVTPTPAGLVLRDRAIELLTTADGIGREVQLAAGEPRQIMIGSLPTGAQHLVAPVLPAFRAAHPDVEVVLIDREPPDGYLDVLAGTVDVLITHQYPGMPKPESLGLHREPVLDERLIGLVHRDHPAATATSLADLADTVWVSGPTGRPNRVALEAAAEQAGFVPKVGFDTTDYSVTLTLAQAGLGPTFLPSSVARSDPNDALAELAIAGTEIMVRTISAVYKRPVRSAVLSDLLAALRQPTPQ